MNSTRNPARVFTLLFVIALAAHSGTIYAQESAVGLTLGAPSRMKISERSNLSTWENGRYAGLLSRQVTGYLTRTEGFEYRGRFFLYQQVRREAKQVARPVERSFESLVSISETTLFATSSAYPSLQHLVLAPQTPPSTGTLWTAPAWVSLAPRQDQPPLRLPVTVEYRYIGTTAWNNTSAHHIEARFATRYPLPPSDDPDAPVVEYAGPISSVTGRHTLSILIPVRGGGAPSPAGEDFTGQVAFIRDEVREQYRFANGDDKLVQGHVLIFLSGVELEAQQRIADDLETRIEESELDDVRIEQTTTGVRVTVDALRFEPDQAVLLPGERERLDSLAAALGTVEDRRFLVVGHTADVGSVESQDRLSTERARLVARELASRGIDRERMDVEGRGGSEPVASNENESGRARNRRVEIYIVEQ